MKDTAWKRVNRGNTKNPGCYELGNGHLMLIEENDKYPGIERIDIIDYRGKHQDPPERYYRVLDPKSSIEIKYRTLKNAIRRKE